MTKIMKYIVMLSLFVFFLISSVEANPYQYGSQYDDSIPLKPIGYLLESENINGKIFSFQGDITDQCPNNACWFKVKDSTHEVLVDLKPSNFTMPLGIIGRKVKLNGKVNTKDGKMQVDAISVIVQE